tara:strand:- start:1279 stop:2478 length:1200 start_codon:yes stop_codon:yes gene_type:complete
MLDLLGSIDGLADVDGVRITKPDVLNAIHDMSASCEVIVYSKDLTSLSQILACLIFRRSFVVLDSSWPTHYSESFLNCLQHIPDSSPHVLIATSGSTGQPKLVCHHMDSLFKSANRSLSHSPISSTDAVLLSLSPAAMGGLLTIVKALVSGARLSLCSGHWLDALAPSGQWHLAVVPQQLARLMLDVRLSTVSFKSVLVGGDSAPYLLKQQVEEANLPVIYSYGATETCGQIVATNRTSDDYEALPGVQLDRLNQQLLIQTDTLARGYLTSDGFLSLPMHNGFYVTQDLVEFSPTFKVIGRKDFQFQSGSQLVSPEFIESELLTSSLISQVVVVPSPDDRFGWVPIAYVPDGTDIALLKMHADAHLPKHLRPASFLPLPESLSFDDPMCRRHLIGIYMP